MKCACLNLRNLQQGLTDINFKLENIVFVFLPKKLMESHFSNLTFHIIFLYICRHNVLVFLLSGS
jgi:hypothetical protein